MKRVLEQKNHAQVDSNFGLNQARALYYDFFAGFFLFELLDSRFNLFQKQMDILATSPLNEADLAHFIALKSYLKNASLADLKREYSQTFDIPFGASGGKRDLRESKKRKIHINCKIRVNLAWIWTNQPNLSDFTKR